MKTIMTKKGYNNLLTKLADKLNELKAIQDEKSHAYTASGDGWHDNPGWTQLGQQEEMFSKELNKLQMLISNATIIDELNMDKSTVQIGAKVTVLIHNIQKKQDSNQFFYIVGGGETDIKSKRISYDSPIGSSLVNMYKNDEKEIELPIGKVILKVIDIEYE
jgi:transcription elongation GreA/GreB family factor